MGYCQKLIDVVVGTIVKYKSFCIYRLPTYNFDTIRKSMY